MRKPDLKVAVDATPLTLSSGGLMRYTVELSRALAENFPEDEYWLVSDQPFAMPSPCPPGLRQGRRPVRSWERLWWSLGLAREIARTGAALFHGTNFDVPYLPLAPSVATVHDLSPWMALSWQRDAERVRRRAPFLLGLGLATMIITVSETIRRQAIERFRLHPAKVAAVPLAAGPEFRPIACRPAATPFFLYVGTLEPRKNIALLLEAWRAVRKLHNVDLALAGRRRADFPALAPEPGLNILGEVADADLPALYSQALAFVYPSLYEGFGLPVLEAMQCGAAVVTSRAAAITEVVDGAALQLDARDPKPWIEAMTALATRPDEAAQWRERGLERARAFSWSRTAQLTHEVYVEALSRL
jgi:glycosyltransferase involved in cell wall biosynthesis